MRVLVLLLGTLVGLTSNLLPESAAAQACPDWTATRQPFFGDVHIHSARSFDSYLFDVRAGPRDAYRFAMGEPIGLPPLDPAGEPTRIHQLRRPLDFAAVTDHAEMLGETALCTVAGLGAPACDVFDSGGFGQAVLLFGSQFQDPDPMRRPMCGTEDQLCLAAAASVWQDTRLAAQEFDDPNGDCGFSTFVAYEWTASPGGNNLHRNVLFRSDAIPPLPISYVEAQEPAELWNGLEAQCAEVGADCEALTIPHNSNQSGGQTFLTTETDGSPLRFETALLQNRMEPLVELIQHKGDSECRPGVDTNDELCGFEKIPGSPISSDAPLNYVRNVLKAGVALDAQLGVNPFTLGMIGSSDTHNATPGATSEDDFIGHVGSLDADATARLDTNSILQNPGGLMVLWAEENSRDALFDAMQRRESYATSGTRPGLRFFGGFDLPSGLCASGNLVSTAYATGVPMGGQLAANVSSPAPRFLVHATQDPGSVGFPGTPLSQVQIVKGWVDAQGETRESVLTIAGGPPAPNALDLVTCEPDGSGAAVYCAEWQDPDFVPDQHAFYYTRVLESPTCRWSTRQCRAEGILCDGNPPPPGFEACCDGSVPESIQERATSSPIWLRPAPEPGFRLTLAIGGLLIALATRSSGRDPRRKTEGAHPAPSAPDRAAQRT